MSIELKKKAEQVGIVLAKQKIPHVCCQVAMSLDVSGSTHRLYHSGVIQRTIERLLPVAMRFDDNEVIDTWIFDESSKELPQLVEDNLDNYVEEVLLPETELDSGTCYAPMMLDIIGHYFGPATRLRKILSFFSNMFKRKSSSPDPVFAMVITDGDNQDSYHTMKVLEENKDKNIFWVFVGVGNTSFRGCEEMRDKHRNVELIRILDLEKVGDGELYASLINDRFVGWVKSKGITVN